MHLDVFALIALAVRHGFIALAEWYVIAMLPY